MSYTRTNRIGDITWFNDADKIHRDNDEPAVECVNGDREWYCNGERHRDNGPAIVRASGRIKWFKNGKLHREDGPAHIYNKAGSPVQEWWENGIRHRTNAPAIINRDGRNIWFFNGKQIKLALSEEFFNVYDLEYPLNEEELIMFKMFVSHI